MRDKRKEERKDKKEEWKEEADIWKWDKVKRKERVRRGQEESMQCHYA